GLDIHHNRQGIWVSGASEVLVRDVSIHDNSRAGMRLFSGAHDVQIIDSRSERNDDGLGCRGDADGFSADETTTAISFEGVTAIANAEDGFDLASQGVTLRRVAALSNGCSGLKLGTGALLENALVIGQRIGVNLNGPAGAITTLQNATLLDNSIGLRALGDG